MVGPPPGSGLRAGQDENRRNCNGRSSDDVTNEDGYPPELFLWDLVDVSRIPFLLDIVDRPVADIVI